MRLDERRIRRYVSFRFVSFRTCIFFCARLCAAYKPRPGDSFFFVKRTTERGLFSAVDSPSEQRYEVVGVLNAKTDIQRLQIEDMWGTATSDEAHDKLKCCDVTVTNQKDKEFFLPKIMKINRAVMLAFYSSLAAEELLRS